MFQTALGGLIALAGSVVVLVLNERVRRNSERKSLAGALVAELESITAVLEARKIVEYLRQYIQERRPGYTFEFGEVSPIYDKLLDRIGVLPPRALGPTVEAYFYLRAGLEDVKNLQSLSSRQEKYTSGPEPREWVTRYAGLLYFLEKFLKLAALASDELRSLR